jgi:leader peptidase (prepilin peptidase)/N-methyltransferase
LTELPPALVAGLGAVLGLAIGSFLNVMVYRVPRGESIVSPPSACPTCRTPIRNRHNIPVIGWLILRGECYDCGSAISPRYPLVEAGTGVLFALASWRFADRPALLAAYLTFAAIAFALALIDLDVHRLPNTIVLPAYPILALLLVLDTDVEDLTRAGIGAAALFAFFFLIAFVAPGAIGFGDVKLAGIVGGMTAYLSWGAFLSGAFGAFLLGAIVGVLLMVTKRAGRKTAVPFGPFMLVAAWASILGASGLGEAYLEGLGL